MCVLRAVCVCVVVCFIVFNNQILVPPVIQPVTRTQTHTHKLLQAAGREVIIDDFCGNTICVCVCEREVLGTKVVLQ